MLPTAQSTPTPTFSPARTAPRPQVVPLYATTVPRRIRHPLGIHQIFPSKSYYKPYPSGKPPKLHTHDLLSCLPGNSSIPLTPGSPLTPVEEEGTGGPSQDVHINFIPCPSSKVTVTDAGWDLKVLPSYRVRKFPQYCTILLTIRLENCQESS